MTTTVAPLPSIYDGLYEAVEKALTDREPLSIAFPPGSNPAKFWVDCARRHCDNTFVIVVPYALKSNFDRVLIGDVLALCMGKVDKKPFVDPIVLFRETLPKSKEFLKSLTVENTVIVSYALAAREDAWRLTFPELEGTELT